MQHLLCMKLTVPPKYPVEVPHASPQPSVFADVTPLTKATETSGDKHCSQKRKRRAGGKKKLNVMVDSGTEVDFERMLDAVRLEQSVKCVEFFRPMGKGKSGGAACL